ncbi:WD40-repeat-containing domain protein [Scheffersomyces xylosifermentans]|uniref:WD40-repeat-containing domain protein n=1 Tax=Scheffersomyces xylosifermentans TaxID=1304137 RepID=UPI00315C74DF
MSLKESATLDVGFPIMSAKFINNKTVLVTGGGGEGNNGIPNKITAIKCSFKVQDPKRRLQRFREITLPSNEDSPQCLDTGKIVDDEENKFSVFVGCNQSSQLIRSMNINNNLRKYVYTNEEHLRFVDAAQLEEEIVGDVDDYPKVIRLSTNSGVGSFMTSSVPSAIYIFNPDSLELKFKYKPEKEVEIKDFALSPEDDGKTLVYVTSNSIEAVSTSDASKVSTSIKNTKTDSELKKFILSKVRFLNNDIVIVSASSRGSKGAVLLKYSLSEQKILKQSLISKKFNNIVALDISQSQDLVAVAGNDLSLTVIRLSDFKVLSTYPKLHPFAITSVAFSPNGSKLATGSAANTLHVFRVPQHHARGKSTLGTLFQYLFTILFVAFIAFGLQKSHESGQLDEVYSKV